MATSVDSDSTDIAGLLAETVELVLQDDLQAARAVVATITSGACWDEYEAARGAVQRAVTRAGGWALSAPDTKRKNPSLALRDAVYARDHYRCRYAHCGRLTVHLHVIKALSVLMPDVLPYHPNRWNRIDTHGLVQTASTSFEHITPVALGGNNDKDNVVTACACCNYSKYHAPIEQLGWDITPEPDPHSDTWDGLVAKVPALEERAMLAASAAGEGARASVPSSRKRSANPIAGHVVDPTELCTGDYVHLALPGKIQRRRYRVTKTEPGSLSVTEVWRDHNLLVWVDGSTYEVLPFGLSDIELLGRPAPTAGQPIT